MRTNHTIKALLRRIGRGLVVPALFLCTLSAAAQTPVAADTLAVTGAETELSPDELWNRANTAYLNGDYRDAIGHYEKILDRGLVSARLYYNLANAYFKEGQLGESILYYHRSLRLAPGNEDARYNLGVAETMTRDRIEEIPEFFAVTWMRALSRTMGCTAWSLVSLVWLAALLGLLLLYLLARRIALRKTGFYGTLVAFLLFVLSTWCAAVERRDLLRTDEAIVLSASATVKSSPDRSATDLFVLHEGTRATVTGELEEWSEITLADGKKGWLESRNIAII